MGALSVVNHISYHLLSFILCLSFVTVFLFVPVSSSFAQEPVNITADSLEYSAETKEYIAIGSVQVLYEDVTLQADMVRFNNTTADATASGNVVYEDAEVLIRADRIELNFDTKLGTIYKSYIFHKKQNYHIQGGNLQRLGETTYFMDRATATTCDAKPGEWYITGEDISLKLRERLEVKKATFYIKDKPVFYTPYFWAPLARKRETGFLMPSFGYSSTKGFTFQQGFFWALKENMDATFYADIFSEKGVGKGLDYRYIKSAQTNGELWMYHLKDNSLKRNFFEIKSYHNQKLPNKLSGYLKIHYVNEFDFYDELKSPSAGRIGLDRQEINPFGFASEERLQRYLESNLHISRPLKGGRAYLLGQYRESLEESSGTIPHVLPEIGFVLNTRELGKASFNVSVTGTNFWRKNGQKGQRLDLYPNFFLSLGRTINFTQKVGLRETLYFLEDPAKNESREIFDLRSILSTRFLRHYPSFIHLVEPSIEYEYVPGVDQRDLPAFDSEDFMPQASTIAYSLTNRLAGPAMGGLQARVRLSNSYSMLDVEKPFSPILLETNLTSRNLNFSANAQYDVYEETIEETIASVLVQGKRGYIGIEKNFRRSTSLDQYSIKVGVFRPLQIYGRAIPVDLSGSLLYDLKGGGVQELNINSRYSQQCWSMGVSYTRRPFEYQIMFAIEFKGLGTIKLGTLEDYV
jgi:LPS-assembly protein